MGPSSAAENIIKENTVQVVILVTSFILRLFHFTSIEMVAVVTRQLHTDLCTITSSTNKCFQASHLHCCRSNTNTVRTELSQYFTLTSSAKLSAVDIVCIVKLAWQVQKSVRAMKAKCQEVLLLLRLLLLLWHLVLFQVTNSLWSSSLLLCMQSALCSYWLSRRQF